MTNKFNVQDYNNNIDRNMKHYRVLIKDVDLKGRRDPERTMSHITCICLEVH